MDNKEPDTKQKQNYENYEKNLKLQLESFRKDLDAMLTKSSRKAPSFSYGDIRL